MVLLARARNAMGAVAADCDSGYEVRRKDQWQVAERSVTDGESQDDVVRHLIEGVEYCVEAEVSLAVRDGDDAIHTYAYM